MKNDIQIEMVPVAELVGYERNARTHSADQVTQLVASIQEFGFTNPVLIDDNNVLSAGHGRTTAARQIGLDHVPAIRLSGLTEEQIKALRIADNQLALNAGMLGNWPPWTTALIPNLISLAIALAAIIAMEHRHALTGLLQRRRATSRPSAAAAP